MPRPTAKRLSRSSTDRARVVGRVGGGWRLLSRERARIARRGWLPILSARVLSAIRPRPCSLRCARERAPVAATRAVFDQGTRRETERSGALEPPTSSNAARPDPNGKGACVDLAGKINTRPLPNREQPVRPTSPGPNSRDTVSAGRSNCRYGNPSSRASGRRSRDRCSRASSPLRS